MQQYAVEGLRSCLQANNFYDTHGSTHPTVFCSLLWRKNELVAVYRKNYSSYAYSFRILCAKGRWPPLDDRASRDQLWTQDKINSCEEVGVLIFWDRDCDIWDRDQNFRYSSNDIVVGILPRDSGRFVKYITRLS